jgi:hypothetical protein
MKKLIKIMLRIQCGNGNMRGRIFTLKGVSHEN